METNLVGGKNRSRLIWATFPQKGSMIYTKWAADPQIVILFMY
jgi:hypothetical protein